MKDLVNDSYLSKDFNVKIKIKKEVSVYGNNRDFKVTFKFTKIEHMTNYDAHKEKVVVV